MYYYFSSDFPAAIKLNGIYFGLISDTVKPCAIDNGSTTLVEVCPLIKNEQPLNFLLNEQFLSTPYEDVSITDLKGGYLIKFSGGYKTDEFSVVSQEKFTDAIVTVFNENGLKLSLETPRDFYAETFRFIAKSAEIKRFSLSGNNFISVLLSGKTDVLNVYFINDKIRKVFSREVSDYSANENLSTTETFRDMAKHKVQTHWEFKDGTFSICSRSVTTAPTFSSSSINVKLLPFAFLEGLLVGEDVKEYITGNLLTHADKLLSFMGEYVGVMPPPLFRSIDEVGVIYPLSDNRYQVQYFTFDFENGKICNIKKSTD